MGRSAEGCLGVVWDIWGWSTLPRKYCPTMKGFSTTSPMRIMALLGDIMGDSLHINRDKIEISHELMEILGFEILVGARGMSR